MSYKNKLIEIKNKYLNKNSLTTKFSLLYKEISRKQGNRLFLEMYKSIKKKFKILKEILKQKNKYIKNLFYIKYKIKIS